MKKKTKTILTGLLTFIVLFASTFSLSFDQVAADEGYTYVYTPNNTPVYVHVYDELLPDQIAYLNYFTDIYFPSATRYSSASGVYNCHSFAWYMQSNLNPYWMDDPSSYYNDYSFEESNGNVGDLVCYFDSTGENLHSGVVVARQQGTPNGVCGDANLITVVSKWGAAGLYQHQGDYCPYVSTYGGEATYVKYYKVHGSHTYDTYYSLSEDNHVISCFCGEYITEQHDLRIIRNSIYFHVKYCTLCNYSKEEAHHFVPLVGTKWVCTDCGQQHNGPVPQPYEIDPELF